MWVSTSGPTALENTHGIGPVSPPLKVGVEPSILHISSALIDLLASYLTSCRHES